MVVNVNCGLCNGPTSNQAEGDKERAFIGGDGVDYLLHKGCLDRARGKGLSLEEIRRIIKSARAVDSQGAR